MSERKKEARSGAGTPNQAEEKESAMRADTTFHSHDTTGAEREQAGILGRVLPHGKGHATPGRELVKLLELKDLRELTQLVERERADGAPICASTDSAAPGYYLADDLGITDSSFSRKLRKELPQEEKEKIFSIIQKLSQEVG